MSKPKQGRGRPTSYKEEYVSLVYKLALLGITEEDMSKVIGVAYSTFKLWKDKQADFSAALKEGREIADSKVGDRLYQRAMGYTHKEEKVFCHGGEIITHVVEKHYPPDTTAMIFWLKNRQPHLWRDKREITGANDEPLIPERSDKEVARQIAFILAEAEEERTQH